jgi:hypothetical protein
MKPALERIIKQAKGMKFYDTILAYNEDCFDINFRQHFQEKFQLRGYGYWVWKPYVVLKALEEINAGDILHYADAGCHLNKRGIKRLYDYFELTRNSPCGISAFGTQKKQFTEKYWTKGDLFEYFNVNERPDIYDTGQIGAGVFFIKKCKESMEIITKWMDLFYNNFSLIDDTPSKFENFNGFNENKYDQSVFSLLGKIYNFSLLPKSETHSLDIDPVLMWQDRYNTISLSQRLFIYRIKKIIKIFIPQTVIKRVRCLLSKHAVL